MATTSNIGLTKPAATDTVNLTTLNSNWDKIDQAIGAISGTISASNNVMSRINNLIPSSLTAGSSTSLSDAIDGVTSANVTADMKLRAKAFVTVAETKVGDLANNASGVFYISAPYTPAGSSTQTGNDAMLILSRGGSNQYYSGIIVAMRSSMPFAFRRAATGRAVTFMI